MSKVVLCILDGWGLGSVPESDALAQANTPFMDFATAELPNATLTTFGLEVGLPAGQMGNSEVGHMNIGAGRVVYQDLAKINKAISDDNLKENAQLQKAIEQAKSSGKAFHLMSLLSDGGVHSHIEHLFALIDIIEDAGIEKIFVHAFLDGRDTDPKAGGGYLKQLQDYLKERKTKLATVVGRYYAMDRDMRWERVKVAYDLLVKGKGSETADLNQTIKEQYDQDITDEFMPAIKLTDEGNITENDIVLFCNFRSDRPRQITEVLTQVDKPEFDMQKLNLHFYTMTQYSADYKNVNVLFEKNKLENTLGEVLSAAGKTQLRIAETEKYPHVTFFFSGGREEPYEGESRILIPSPKVATYDLKPEMSAIEITQALEEHISSKDSSDFIVVNYANTDMVGHTGDFEAAKIAAETVDQCTNRLCKIAQDNGYEILIIADHGNCDFMVNDDGSPNTAHTINPVPVILVSDKKDVDLKSGKLADLAPTILSLMGVDVPEEIDGEILI